MNYLVIGIIIFVLGRASAYAFIRWRRGGAEWLEIALGLMALEVEAMKARDRQKIKDRNAG